MKCNVKPKETELGRTDLEMKYDSICYQAVCLAYGSCYKLAEEVVPIKDFDPSDKEHLFVYHIARAVSGISGRQVAVQGNYFWCRRENKKIQVEGSKLVKYKKEYDEFAIAPDTLITALQPLADEYFGECFDFGNIYDAYYADIGGKQ
jgi:hypothetical protein